MIKGTGRGMGRGTGTGRGTAAARGDMAPSPMEFPQQSGETRVCDAASTQLELRLMETGWKLLNGVKESWRRNSRLEVADKQPQMSAVGEGHGAPSQSKC